MFIREIRSRFRNLRISVSIDPLLLPHLDTADKLSTQRTISFNLYELIYSIGTIQTRRFATSKRQKFNDKSDLIEKIFSDTDDFKVKLTQIRTSLSPEDLTTISSDFGVGLSVVVAMKLFNIRPSTIERIIITGKRPDWRCQTTDNRLLIIESKGSSNAVTSANQQAGAIVQKRAYQGDVQIASLSVLNETTISTTRFVDPPSEINDMDPILQSRILRAGHYASVFSFLGHPVFSKYFAQMRKRLEQNISPNEQQLKNRTFDLIVNKYSRVRFRNRDYAGTFYRVSSIDYLFIGIDIRLVSYEGFINFIDYEEDLDEDFERNHYLRFADGVLIVEIKDIDVFEDVVDIPSIKNFQEYNTLSDIDAMTEISFQKYFLFLLEQNNFRVLENSLSNTSIDIIASSGESTYGFELKLFKNKTLRQDSIPRISDVLASFDGIPVFVTNAEVGEGLRNTLRSSGPGAIIIDRLQLKKMLSNPNHLTELLSQ